MSSSNRKASRGRKASRNADVENENPNREPSATPSKTHSHTSKKGHDKKAQKTKDTDKKDKNFMTKAEVRKFIQDCISGDKAYNQVDPALRPNSKGNDKQVSKNNILKPNRVYSSDTTWSNYPIALPPTLTYDMLEAVRKELKKINDNTQLCYGDGVTWELGELECYDGVSTSDEGNFLSCDCLNPVYVKQCMKRPSPYAPRPNTKDAPSEWMYNSSCFVYAPSGTILSKKMKNNNGMKETIPLNEARVNWKTYAHHPNHLPGTRSAKGFAATEIVSSFWLYKEEFIDFENTNKPTASTPFKVKFRGRIGMFFPIVPMKEQKDHVYSWSTVSDDSIGWGQVARIGEPLDPGWEPKTFNDLQNKIGRYILLTNLWSSQTSDQYRVNVKKQTLINIYKNVIRMTEGDMFVNVRRGRTAYGPLCVLQKNITIDDPEKFGLTGVPETNVYVTQIFTCCKSLTKDFARKAVTETWKHESLSFEEQNLCAIFQSFNNSVITAMKDEAYRNVMVAYWKKPENRIPRKMTSTGPDPQWTINNMLSLMLTMFTTTYELVFEKAVSKVACPQRFQLLSHILTNYPLWFVQSKCIADAAFVKQYEEAQKQAEVNYSSFTGMLTQFVSKDDNAGVVAPVKPLVYRAQQDEIDKLAKMPHASGSAWGPPLGAPDGPPPSYAEFRAQEKSEADKMARELDERHMKMQQDAIDHINATNVKIKDQIRTYVLGVVSAWRNAMNGNGVSAAVAEQESKQNFKTQKEALRLRLAFETYQVMLQAVSSDPGNKENFDMFFERLYPAYFVAMQSHHMNVYEDELAEAKPANYVPEHTPDNLPRTAAVNNSPNRVPMFVESMAADSIADPFADASTHVGEEFMVVSKLDLLDIDEAFRLYFVDKTVKNVQTIRQQCQYPNGGTINWPAFRALMGQATGIDIGYCQIANYVFENEFTPLRLVEGGQKKTFATYFAETYGNEELAQYFHAVLFLAQMQRYAHDDFEQFKQLLRAEWDSEKQTYNAEIDMQSFDKVLMEVDQNLTVLDNNKKKRLQNKRKTETNEGEEHVSKAKSVADLIQENPIFARYALYEENVTIVARHTWAGYSRINAVLSTDKDRERSTEWKEAFDQKPMTKKLYEQTEKLFVSTRANFQQLYPDRKVQWFFCTMRAMNDLTTQEPGSDKKAWDEYLAYAKLMASQNTGTLKGTVTSHKFPLQSNLPSLHADDIKHNDIDTLSARIDRLNDW